ncbi:NADP-dependent oxidoreductase domain-containing protein 1-like [Clupea harengus]|uniref:NADP-dependent oxidoreductase domain-containing protein 1 n=1 Tax=Clupea harengus TaxID=7950 RepID=A0A6P8GG82_CLUHA|nr:NADP-dependent oxidoreductase domain-containing protein 1-like [Clupea harengus]
MFDLTANLHCLQFEAGLTEEEKKIIYLRSRSAALTECSCAHALFYCKLAHCFRTNILMLNDFSSDAGAPHQLTVGIIGGGHLGKQLARLIVESSGIKPPNIKVSSRRPETLEDLSVVGIECFYDNQRLASWADVLFLCCLPSHLLQVCADIRAHLSHCCVVYSFISTVPVKRLAQLLGHTSILRPAYEFVSSDAGWACPPEHSMMAALKNVELIAASCPLSMSRGVCIGAEWLPAVLYSLLNMCCSVLPLEGALELLNQLLRLQSDSALSVHHLISHSCASSQSPLR